MWVSSNNGSRPLTFAAKAAKKPSNLAPGALRAICERLDKQLPGNAFGFLPKPPGFQNTHSIEIRKPSYSLEFFITTTRNGLRQLLRLTPTDLQNVQRTVAGDIIYEPCPTDATAKNLVEGILSQNPTLHGIKTIRKTRKPTNTDAVGMTYPIHISLPERGAFRARRNKTVV